LAGRYRSLTLPAISASESWIGAPGGGLRKRNRTNRPEASAGAAASIVAETRSLLVKSANGRQSFWLSETSIRSR